MGDGIGSRAGGGSRVFTCLHVSLAFLPLESCLESCALSDSSKAETVANKSTKDLGPLLLPSTDWTRFTGAPSPCSISMWTAFGLRVVLGAFVATRS